MADRVAEISNNIDKIKEAIKYVVVTPYEFGEYCLPLILQLLPLYEEREKAKLSIFNRYSFDKMYRKLEKLVEKLANRKNPVLETKDKKQILKILTKYKGKKSPHKKEKVELVKRKIENKEKLRFSDVTELMEKELTPLFKTKDYKPEYYERINDLIAKLRTIWRFSENRFFIDSEYYKEHFMGLINGCKDIIDQKTLNNIFDILSAVTKNIKHLDKILNGSADINTMKWFYAIYRFRDANRLLQENYSKQFQDISAQLEAKDKTWKNTIDKSLGKLKIDYAKKCKYLQQLSAGYYNS